MDRTSEENSGAKSSSHNDDIMLAQFTEMHNDWRYQDGRIENALRLYVSSLAFVATVAGGLIALYSDARNQDLFLWLGLIAGPFLIVLGFFTARRVKNSTISRERRLFAANLAKRYFQDRYTGVTEYLPVFVLTPDTLSAEDDKERYRDEFKQLTVSFPDGIIRFIYATNGFLASVFVLCLFVLRDVPESVERWIVTVLLGIHVYVVQDYWYRGEKTKFNDRAK